MAVAKGGVGFFVFALLVLQLPAVAGPPYVTDDPEPTDTGQFENYLYVEGTRATGVFAGPGAGVEINYGVLADTQLTWSVPLNPNPGTGGIGLAWAPFGGGVKYRFMEEDADGWRPQAAIFPQIFIPVGSAAHATPTTELLPIWLQKSFGGWTTFGGGGFVNNPGLGNWDFEIYGWALQRQITNNLQLGGEIFGQTRSAVGFGASTAVGLAALYDLSGEWHLVGSVDTGIVNAREADRVSYNLALKWTH
ncbi:MAG: transporter [Rhizomicrobium sp.]